MNTRSRRFAATVAALAVLLGACAHQPAGVPAPRPERRAELNRVFDDYYEETLVLDPVTATMLGDHRFDDRMAIEISDEHRARVAAMCRRTLARLAAFAPAELDAEDR